MAHKHPPFEAFLLKIPLLLVLVFIASLAMYVPALHASWIDDHRTARIFFYAGTGFMLICAGIGLATASYVPSNQTRSHLFALVATFVFLPTLLAYPVYEQHVTASFLDVYLEMVSCLTTTGAPVLGVELPSSVHLWRALVGWLGGLYIWITAVAILAPLNLGGFEVTQRGKMGSADHLSALNQHLPSPSARLIKATKAMVPIYFFLTLNVALLLYITGLSGFDAMMMAMSAVATSGITGQENALVQGGFVTEAVLLGALFFALSSLTFASDMKRGHMGRLLQDAELRLAFVIILSLVLFLFARQTLNALSERDGYDAALALKALWGGLFTMTSFLSTTGFESAYWRDTLVWSEWGRPGILLMGLAILGGGVATTAGGVKLLRVYALYKLGRREMDLLLHPTRVHGRASVSRGIPSKGARAAWVFFMLFALSIAVISTGLAWAGATFEEAMVLAIAGLSTTGPLTQTALESSLSLQSLSEAGKLFFAIAMVLGRLETLALIALFNPDFWRN